MAGAADAVLPIGTRCGTQARAGLHRCPGARAGACRRLIDVHVWIFVGVWVRRAAWHAGGGGAPHHQLYAPQGSSTCSTYKAQHRT